MWINTIFSHADIAGSLRVSKVVGVYSILGHGGLEKSKEHMFINVKLFLG